MLGFVASLLLAASLAGHLTVHAVPVAALQSLVVLSSSNAPPCIGAALPEGLLLTPISCSLDTLDTVCGIDDVSFLEADAANIQLTLQPPTTMTAADMTVVWSDDRTRILRYGGANVSVSSLALPAHATALPPALEEDSDATILDVDATTLRVSSIDQVVFVDNALCGPTTTATSVCVLPLKVDDRRSGVLPSSQSFRFLIKRDVVAGNHVLLGLGLPLSAEDSDTNARHADGFRHFTWLDASLQDAAIARSVGKSETEAASAASEAGRQFDASQIDMTTPRIAAILDDRNVTRCTGVLIAPRAVLTSRQCENFTHSYVRLGMRDPDGKTPQEVLPVFSYMRHKKYNNATGAYDGLVLRLAKPSAHSVAALQTDTSVNLQGKNARIYGFGTAYIYTNAPVGPANDVCGPRVKRSLLASEFCASGGTSQQGCFNPGDMGAPLFIDSGTTREQLAGILFDSKGCSSSNGLSVFTRVTSIMTLVREGIKRSNLPTETRAIAGADDDALFEETLVA